MTVDSDSKKRSIELIKKLRVTKINIILEPYPWIQNGSIGKKVFKRSIIQVKKVVRL